VTCFRELTAELLPRRPEFIH